MAEAPTAFLPRLELARCHDLSWRFGEVEAAIREALAALRAETHAPAAPRPTTGPRLAGIDVPVPERTRAELAKYPDRAATESTTGLVIIEATIDQQGRVSKAAIAKSVRHLDTAAVDAAKKWRFAPSVVNGQLVEVITYLPMRFGPSATMWASDYLELGRFYYERRLWQHAEAALEVAREQARQDLIRFGPSPIVLSNSTPADFPGWPKVRKEVKPRYTQAAMRAKIQGTVELEVLLDRSGVVGRTNVVKQLRDLTFAAELAAMQWQFSPAMVDGQPTPAIVLLSLDFRLH